eukprot:TRINITY_DN1149_c0_g3_i7.p1 TRINITY_DN1149_c0_g3~~TRINITY_DN1149_c0_g3_i7.p1  ORF type:complete len:797 (+),score=134.26 TRINITY_DN1149_c0_g3_i7:66-2456(+)
MCIRDRRRVHGKISKKQMNPTTGPAPQSDGLSSQHSSLHVPEPPRKYEPTAPLLDILEDDYFVDELRSGNASLIEYFSWNRTETVHFLLASLLDDPRKITTKEQMVPRLPLLAMEILESRPSPLIEEILCGPAKGKMHLETLFGFVCSTSELKEMHAGFFGRIVCLLLDVRPAETINFALGRETIRESLVQHVSYRSVMEVLLRIITIDSTSIVRGNEQLNRRLTLTHSLWAKALDERESDEGRLNASEVLVEVISRYETVSGGRELLSILTSRRTVDKCFLALLQECKRRTVSAAQPIIAALLTHYTKFRVPEEETPLFDAFSKTAAALANFLKFNSADRSNSLQTTFGTTMIPLGGGKLRLIELFEGALRLNDNRLNLAIAESEALSVILELFVIYQWNNVLHQTFERILDILLATENVLLLQKLLSPHECDMVLQLMRACQDPLAGYHSRGSQRRFFVRRGNIGHMIRVLNKINDASSTFPFIRTFLEATEGWVEFVGTILHPTNLNDMREWGGETVSSMVARKASVQADPASTGMKSSLTGPAFRPSASSPPLSIENRMLSFPSDAPHYVLSNGTSFGFTQPQISIPSESTPQRILSPRERSEAIKALKDSSYKETTGAEKDKERAKMKKSDPKMKTSGLLDNKEAAALLLKHMDAKEDERARLARKKSAALIGAIDTSRPKSAHIRSREDRALLETKPENHSREYYSKNSRTAFKQTAYPGVFPAPVKTQEPIIPQQRHPVYMQEVYSPPPIGAYGHHKTMHHQYGTTYPIPGPPPSGGFLYGTAHIGQFR